MGPALTRRVWKWKRQGELFTRWVDETIPATRLNCEIPGPTVVEVFQIWRLLVFGLPLWKSRIVVGKLDINQWITRVPLGDPLLTPEQWEAFNRPCIAQGYNFRQNR